MKKEELKLFKKLLKAIEDDKKKCSSCGCKIKKKKNQNKKYRLCNFCKLSFKEKPLEQIIDEINNNPNYTESDKRREIGLRNGRFGHA